ncbi:MAG: aldehyde dehydrogenase family protein, partial [Chloroflexi bacterium]|nr:aldehyde dehydrogenase family protein [Chloroflexota bacterium]
PASERLGRMAVEETTYGVAAHKTLKNHLCSKILWDSISDVKTVGVIRHDERKRIYDIAWPMGVVAALTPSTNPTSTVMFKIMISVKARDAIVVAPHPTAVKCCVETARIMAEAAERAGAPKGLVSCMSVVALPGTEELMKHRYTALILATGGSAMVKAAHSVGKPAYGVGPGNVPCYVDRSADLYRAARYLVASKAFDYSVICATEQAAVVDKPAAAQFEELAKAEGAYFVNEEQANALRRLLFFPDGGINAKTVGQSPQTLAQWAGFSVPASARILVAKLSKVGRDEPLSREKLTTVLGWYEADGWEAGCDRCIELINFGGRGHSLVIHAENEKVIMAFGLEKPAFRIVVNTMGTLGATGLTTGVMPSMTLGPGGIGGAITGDNITVQHMFNVKRLAYELNPPPDAAMKPGDTAAPVSGGMASVSSDVSPDRIDEIVQRVLAELKR